MSMNRPHPYEHQNYSLQNGMSFQSLEIQRLKEENLTLRAQNSVLQTNIQSLISALSMRPSLPVSIPTPPPASMATLNEEDFPDSKFWHKKQWTDRIKKDAGKTSTPDHLRATKGCLLFMTNETGDFPTPARVEEARNHCYSLFFEYNKEGTLPNVWGEASATLLARFRSSTEAAFPELRYCASHWKSDRLARLVYASWCGTHRKKEKVKSEVLSDPEDDDSSTSDIETVTAPVVASKRARAGDIDRREAKKIKGSTPKPRSSDQLPKAKRMKNPLYRQTPATIQPTATNADEPSDTPETTATTGTPPTPPLPPSSIPSASGLVSAATTISPLEPVAVNPVSLESVSPAVLISPLESVPPLMPPSSCSPSLSAHCLAWHSNTSTCFSQAGKAVVENKSAVIPNASDGAQLPPTPTPNQATVLPTAGTSPTAITVTVTAPTLLPPPQTPAIINAPLPKVRKWNPAANSTTARGMCSYEYKQKHPNATAADFDEYYKKLSTADKQPYKDREIAAKAAKAQAAAG
ncbi:hypothetical protein MSAN_00312400 [Mycena sanguinolenta]|uniref:Uncharacterized protein n=1 Tax=Mycena sanguinolenta TaxID=230812 RepID=A0A8H7DIC1_9AGAR|nr:hypothetical protein MSAN_00312400 [Mycena sanguinolenta]